MNKRFLYGATHVERELVLVSLGRSTRGTTIRLRRRAVEEAPPGGNVAVEMLNCQSPFAVALQPYAKLEKRPRVRGGREPGATCRG